MFGYATAMARYASFAGKSGRAEFWSYSITVVLITVAARLAELHQPALLPYSALIAIIHATPTLAVQVRRLHDVGRSGWWILLGLTAIGTIPLLFWFCYPSTPDQTRIEPAFRNPQAAFAPSQDGIGRQGDNVFPPGVLGDATFIGLLVAGWAVVLMLYAYRADLKETGAGLLAFALEGSEITDVPGFLIARHIDNAKVVTGGSVFLPGAAGFPLLFVARCLGQKTPPFSADRNLSIVDEGRDQYRLIQRTSGTEIDLHVRMLSPDIALFDELDSGTLKATSPDDIDGALLPAVSICMAANKTR